MRIQFGGPRRPVVAKLGFKLGLWRAVGAGIPRGPKAHDTYSLGREPQEMESHPQRADGPPQGPLESIPHVPFVESDSVIAKQLAIFVSKGAGSMMLFLAGNVGAQ